MSLDAHVKTLLDQMAALKLPKFSEIGPQAARAAMRSRILNGAPTAIGKTEDRTIPGPGGAVPVRVYTPLDAKDATLPALVFFHGGGFVIGDLETHDDLCRCLANGSGCRVIAVDYRLAPEHRFPAAVDECFAAVKYVAAHPAEFGIDPARLAVGGDSAGGNLAAVVSQIAKMDSNTPAIAFQLLVYPVTQLGAPVDTPSMRENGKGYFLEKEGMDWFTRCYAPDPKHRSDPRLSPLLCTDMAGLPPAYVVTAGFDPLRDEGRHYADKLDAAGVPVTYVNYPGMVHGFFSMRGLIPKAREAVAAAAAAVREGVRPATD
ncbi:MAG TPA: alpha/beta hydrolase [Rhizomicrobium sp.]|jgi:acetyl esterase|nr:alpha/beta hydrolase [Rhizomicrobium sp.]